MRAPAVVEGPVELIFSAYANGKEVHYEEVEFLPEDGPIYTDGSALFLGTPAEAAGLAIIQGKPGTNLLKIIVVTIGSGWPRTAPFAENLAIMIASQRARGAVVIVTDCLGALRNFQAEPQMAMAHSAMFGGLVKQGGKESSLTIRKIKAHRTKEEAAREGDLDGWWMNLWPAWPPTDATPTTGWPVLRWRRSKRGPSNSGWRDLGW